MQKTKPILLSTDEDTWASVLRVYQQRKKAPNQDSLWLDDTFSSLSGALAKDSPLDPDSTNDQRWGLTRSARWAIEDNPHMVKSTKAQHWEAPYGRWNQEKMDRRF